jgi:hypothetical protein
VKKQIGIANRLMTLGDEEHKHKIYKFEMLVETHQLNLPISILPLASNGRYPVGTNYRLKWPNFAAESLFLALQPEYSEFRGSDRRVRCPTIAIRGDYTHF